MGRSEIHCISRKDGFSRLVVLVLCFWVCSFFFTAAAQVIDARPVKTSRGIESAQLTGGRVLAFVKGSGKRNIYVPGSPLKVKMLDGKKYSGRINIVRDTDFYLSGKRIVIDSIQAYYVPMRACLIVGTALCVAGGGYMVLDGFNGLVNKKKPAFHTEALAVGIPMAAAGAAILPFQQVKRRTSVWRPRVMEFYY